MEILYKNHREGVMLKRLYLNLTLFLSILVVSAIVVPLAVAEPILIRFSHVVGENTPKGIGAKMFKELVEQRLAGKVRVEIYPRSQRFTDEQALLGLLFGDVEMAAPSFTKFRKFSRVLQVFDLPFLFENVDEIHAFQQSETGQKLLSSMEDRGIKGLTYWDNGMRVISANRPIRTPADLKGLTLRIEPSYVFQRQYSSFGAIATPMPFKRLPGALRVGVVDGYENAWSNVLSRGLHLLRHHFTEVGHSYLGYMVVTSVAFWDRLPADVQVELKSILDEVTAVVNKLAKEKARADREVIMKTSNVAVIKLDAAAKKQWREAMQPLWKEFEADIGTEVMEAAKAVRSAEKVQPQMTQ